MESWSLRESSKTRQLNCCMISLVIKRKDYKQLSPTQLIYSQIPVSGRFHGVNGRFVSSNSLMPCSSTTALKRIQNRKTLFRTHIFINKELSITATNPNLLGINFNVIFFDVNAFYGIHIHQSITVCLLKTQAIQ